MDEPTPLPDDLRALVAELRECERSVRRSALIDLAAAAAVAALLLAAVLLRLFTP